MSETTRIGWRETFTRKVRLSCITIAGTPFADVNLEDALRVIRPTLTLRGNIDQVEFLRSAEPPEVRDHVRQLLEKVKARGNWILSTTGFPFDGQPYANLHALAEAGQAYGAYS